MNSRQHSRRSSGSSSSSTCSGGGGFDLDSFAAVDPLAQRRTGSFEPMPQHVREKLYHLLKTTLEFFNIVLGTTSTTTTSRCWVTAGTLLGSLRHKDLIPWDDDCDVCVLRCPTTDFLVAHAEELMERAFRQQPQQQQHQSATEPTKQLVAALSLLREQRVAFYHAPRVGLRFYIRGDNTTTSAMVVDPESCYPFCDVFIMRSFPSIAALRQKHVVVADNLAKSSLLRGVGDEGEESDENGDQSDRLTTTSSPVLVIDDVEGRDIFLNDTYFAKSVEKLVLVPFGPSLKVPIPSPMSHVEDFLVRNYGADWRVVAKTHSLNHETKQKLNVVSAPLDKVIATTMMISMLSGGCDEAQQVNAVQQ